MRISNFIEPFLYAFDVYELGRPWAFARSDERVINLALLHAHSAQWLLAAHFRIISLRVLFSGVFVDFEFSLNLYSIFISIVLQNNLLNLHELLGNSNDISFFKLVPLAGQGFDCYPNLGQCVIDRWINNEKWVLLCQSQYHILLIWAPSEYFELLACFYYSTLLLYVDGWADMLISFIWVIEQIAIAIFPCVKGCNSTLLLSYIPLKLAGTVFDTGFEF